MQETSKAPAKGGHPLIKWLTLLSVGLIALQPISAGFWLSGFEHASALHALGAGAVLLVAVLQCLAALVLLARHRVDARVVARCLGLLLIVVGEAWAGRHGEYWLHLPVGVGLLTWLRR